MSDWRADVDKELLSGNLFLPLNFNSTKNNIPEFIIGREEEFALIKRKIHEILKDGHSQIMRFFGTPGVGKSSIFLYLREKITSGDFPEILDLDPEVKPELTLLYLEMEGNIPEEGLILKLYRGIYDEFRGDGYFKDLSYEVVGKIAHMLFLQDKRAEEQFKKYFSESEIDDLTDPFELQDMLETRADKYRTLKKVVSRSFKKVKDPTRAIRDVSQNFMDLLIQICDPNEDRAKDALDRLSGSVGSPNYGVSDDSSAIEMLSNILRVVKFVYPSACVIISIDHLEKYTRGANTEKMDHLFTLIMELRNNISMNTLVVFLSTIQGYKDMLEGMRSSHGDRTQLFLGWDGGEQTIESISTDSFVDVISHHWDKWQYESGLSVPFEFRLYPFSTESLKYIYVNYSNSNIRWALQKLREVLDEFRHEGKVDYIDTRGKMSARVELNELSHVQKQAEEISSAFWLLDRIPHRVESALENTFVLLKPLSATSGFPILNVSRNKKVSDDCNRRPDVFIQFGSSTPECAVELQVKAYKNSNLKFEDLESSIEMLEKRITDICVLFTTKAVDQILIARLGQYQQKIRYLILDNEVKQAYLAILLDELREKFVPTLNFENETIREVLHEIGIDLNGLYKQALTLKSVEGTETNRSLGDTETTVAETTDTTTHTTSVIEVMEKEIDQYLSRIKGLGAVRSRQLKENGIMTLEQLASLDFSQIDSITKSIRGVTKPMMVKWKEAANLIINELIEEENVIGPTEGNHSSINQHFLREDPNLGLNRQELLALEKKGVLTLEEMAEPDFDFLRKRLPNILSQSRIDELRKRCKLTLSQLAV